jgi:hypothetical protein
MKFRLPVSLLVAFTILMGAQSCTHDYTCTCKISYTGIAGLPDTVTKEYKIKDTKDNAKSLCEKNSNKSDSLGITTTERCFLY